jgi:hypothetical protein
MPENIKYMQVGFTKHEIEEFYEEEVESMEKLIECVFKDTKWLEMRK